MATTVEGNGLALTISSRLNPSAMPIRTRISKWECPSCASSSYRFSVTMNLRTSMIGQLPTTWAQHCRLWRVKLDHCSTSTRAAALVRWSLENRSEEHTSELQSRGHLVCRLLLEKKKINSQ